MGLFDEWKKLSEKQRDKKEYDEFWNTYLEKEKGIYEKILEDKQNVIEGTVTDLAARLEMDGPVLMGFLDGINTSLVNSLELEKLEPETVVKLEIDFEKLYWNMLEAKAEWLYTLEQWDDILSSEKREEITKDFKRSKIAVSNKVGRNDPCPCGSGKKYKKCCGLNE